MMVMVLEEVVMTSLIFVDVNCGSFISYMIPDQTDFLDYGVVG
jgi:hypothetical protein